MGIYANKLNTIISLKKCKPPPYKKGKQHFFLEAYAVNIQFKRQFVNGINQIKWLCKPFQNAFRSLLLWNTPTDIGPSNNC